jgi:hypothetical protein
MSKEKVIVFYDTNWADEMDISGFQIMDQDKWNDFKTKVAACKKRMFVGFGTNEDNEYSEGKHLLAELTAKKISAEEIKVLNKLFGPNIVTYGYGHTSFMNVLESVEDEEV